MELKIFNSIIFTELRPWQPENQIESVYIEKLRKLDRQNPVNSIQLYTSLNILLSDHPRLTDFSSDYLQPSNHHLIKSLFDVETLNFFNATTEFYLNLIRFESIRVKNNFIAAIDAASDIQEKKYWAKIAFKNIKNIVLLSADEFKSRNLERFIGPLIFGSPNTYDLKNTNTSFALYILKQYSISLLFDLQIIFKDYLDTIVSHDDFYLYTLQEPVTAHNVITYSVYYYETQTLRIIKDKQFKQEEAFQLLDSIKAAYNKGKTDLALIMVALENYFLVKLFDLSIKDLDFANFANSAIIANSQSIFTHTKQSIQKQINQKTYGHQRLEIIQDNIDVFSAMNFQTEIKTPSTLTSAPRKLSQWLNDQKDIYKLNLSAVFSPEPDPAEELRKKSKPLSKKVKPSLDEMKTIANEILKYMSGVNINNEKIMETPQFNRMLAYTFQLIETNKVPSTINKIPQINISAETIRYTFYQIHKALYGIRPKRDEWIDFLHAVFYQFDNSEWNTTKTKFSVKPSLWDTDMKLLKK